MNGSKLHIPEPLLTAKTLEVLCRGDKTFCARSKNHTELLRAALLTSTSHVHIQTKAAIIKVLVRTYAIMKK